MFFTVPYCQVFLSSDTLAPHGPGRGVRFGSGPHRGSPDRLAQWQRSRLVLGRCLLVISTGTPTVLTVLTAIFGFFSSSRQMMGYFLYYVTTTSFKIRPSSSAIILQFGPLCLSSDVIRYSLEVNKPTKKNEALNFVDIHNMNYLYGMHPDVYHGITTILYTNVNNDKSILIHHHLLYKGPSRSAKHTLNIQALNSLLTRTKPAENEARQKTRRAARSKSTRQRF